jgi:hypothetical protein
MSGRARLWTYLFMGGVCCYYIYLMLTVTP